jgi:hypothetical protein
LLLLLLGLCGLCRCPAIVESIQSSCCCRQQRKLRDAPALLENTDCLLHGRWRRHLLLLMILLWLLLLRCRHLL